MKCTINDVNLSFDKEGRLRKTIMRVSGHDADKAYVLASFLNDANFVKFLLKNINKDNVLNGETVLFDKFNKEDYVKLNQNKLGALLNVYYIDHYFSVDNSKTNKGMGKLNGFSSGSAKTIAKNHTASLIIDEYRKEINKPKNKRRKPLEIIADVNDKLLNTFYDRTKDFAQYVLSNGNYSKEAKDYAKSYIDIINNISKINNDNQYDKNFIDALQARKAEQENIIKDAKIEGSIAIKNNDINTAESINKKLKQAVNNINEIDKELKSLINRINARIESGVIASRDKYVIAQNFINLYSNNYDVVLGTRLRNYANLVAQTRGDANGWYFQVFNTKTMTSIIKEFNNVGDIDEYLEQQDDNSDDIFNKYNGESIDETTKSWEDNLYKNFNQIINGKLKMILSTVPKLAEKYNPTDNVQAIDTNNELGVQTYMDSQHLTVQIFSFGDFSSVDSLIKSLDDKSKSIKSIYGLGQIVNMMKNNRTFANFVFANFAKPIANKTMLTISDVTNSEGFEFDYSNPNAFPFTELVFRMTNKIRATYNTNYSGKDISYIDKLVENFNRNKNKEILIEKLFDIVNKYFPNFNKELFNNYFDNIPADKLNNSIKSISVSLQNIIKGVGKLKDQINIDEENIKKENDIKWQNYKNDLIAYNKFSKEERKGIKQPEVPIRKYINYATYDLNKDIYSGIINFAKQIVNYTESRARLNTSNAEGNSASDVLKNCYITRFFDQIVAESEEDSNAGLKMLKSYITQGTNNGANNQYANNPLFFGIKDENGITIVPGMFNRTATGVEINDNAKDILKYSLFDGSKNTQDNKGSGYAGMSKLDFFITQFMAFQNSVNENTDRGRTKKIGNLDSAVYSMRIGSDAPKIFFIRAPKYNNRQIGYSFYNHVLDELNMFVLGLNKIFIKEADGVFRTRTNVDNLIGRAFFNEKEVAKLREKGKTDFTSAIVDNGKLTGNLFKFYRLFDTNGYKASEAIESMLSLYGEGDNNQLITKDINGRLRLTPNDTIFYDGEKFVLNLSNEQKNELKNIVREWIKNFLIESKSRTTGFIKVLDDNNIKYSIEDVDKFLLNTANMNMNYDDLFEGDYKFYTNARDFLKRTKESQAGGDGYASYDLLDDPRNGLHEIKYNNKQDVIIVESTDKKDNNGAPVKEPLIVNGHHIVARNGWRGLTIYNTNKPSDYAPQLQQRLETIFKEQNMSDEVAHERSVKIAEGYVGKTKINDAQSYITFEEFIRRRYADGTIQDYMPLIKQLTDDTPVEEINLDEINSRIQVQKNFYYDKIFDKETGLFYPRQIKNAEFVLIPKLIKGIELEKVYNFMIKNDIGQLNTAETSKAAKKNILTIWRSDTGEFVENFEENYNNEYIENYYYQYLYKQQDVPQHMVDEYNKAGVQIMKKIIDNIINENDVNNPEREKLRKWANEYQDAYSANIEEDFNLLLDSMGWEYDYTTGHIVNSNYATTDFNGNKLPEEIIKTNRETLNFNNFYARAREEASRLGMDSNFIEYLIPNEFGNPTMPNYMNNVSNKLESVAQAIYNGKITRQVLPGWHAAQITRVGYSRNLKFDAENGVMEVLLPRWSNLIPKGKNVEEEASILKQIQDEGLDIHLGYRIPTEGKQSISVLKVVGFTNDCLGSTIVVPDEWVTQTGSDFDVDSVYGICWEMYRSRDNNGNITLHKIPFEENTINDRDLYIKFVNNQLDAKVKRTDLGEEIESKIKEVKDSLNFVNEGNELNYKFLDIDKERNELFDELPKWAKGIIKGVNKTAKIEKKKNKIVTDLRDVYSRINIMFDKYLENNKVDYATKDIVEQYIDYQTGLIDVMNRQEGIPSFDKNVYKSQKAEAIQSVIEEAKHKYFEKIKEAAKQAGIISYGDWNKQSFVKKLDRRARNNYIIDRMIKIMNDKTSREEQYGRSNFDKITDGKNGANDIIDEISGEKSRSRSPYNPLDQLDYFEDAMGGARLKALSVNWDTFTSKNNKIRTFLNENDIIEVILNTEDNAAKESRISYNIDEIKKSYGDDIIEYEQNKRIINKKNNITQHNNKYFDTRKEMLNAMISDADGFIGEVSKSPYVKQSDKFIIKNETEVEKAVNYISKRGIPKNRKIDLLSKETIDYLNEVQDFTNYYNVGYSSGSPEITAITNRDLYDENYIPKTIMFLRDSNRLNQDISTINLKQFKDSSTFLIDINDNKAVEYFKNNGYKYIIYYSNSQQYINNDTIIKDNINDQTNNGKRIIYKARRLGWSNNNRNIVGELITTYTSQTTAHHLDAVKMGSVPNVDEYTFSVYKLLSTLGIDYETIISFIRQPIITNLVNNNNLINSVFVSNKNKPIKMTLTDIASSLNLKFNNKEINKYSLAKDVIGALQNDERIIVAFNNLFGIDISSMSPESVLNIKLSLNKERMFTRIKRNAQNIGDIYENAAFDLGMLLTFKNIQATADKINNIITVTSADKFGAKPSIRETRNTVDKINKLRNDMTLSKNGKSFIDLIYPTVEGNENLIDVDKSEYKSIASVYAYATLPSLQTNSKLFKTEDEVFALTEQIVQDAIHHKFTESEYKEYKKYGMMYLYNTIQQLLTPLTIDERGVIISNKEQLSENENELKTANKYWDVERSRIYGYGITTDGDFDIENINFPIKNEIDKFNKLTPAQKVIFIQKHFPDYQGIFNYIKVTLLNNTDIKYKGISRQYLSYDDQVDSIEDMFDLFIKSFANKNPLIKLATIDLIKYAFIAEGFNFRSGYITKIIPNSVLYTSRTEGGFDIINKIKREIDDLAYEMRTDEFIDNFVRSHSDITPIIRLPKLPNKIIDKFDGTERYFKQNESTAFKALTRIDNLIHIDATNENEIISSLIGKLNLKNYIGGFIRINVPINETKSTTILYKIETRNNILDTHGDVIGYKDYFLIPQNLLDKYETYDYSYNQNYNIYNSKEYYNDVIEKLAIAAENARTNKVKNIRIVINNEVKQYKNPIGNYKPIESNFKDNPTKLMELYDKGDEYTKGAVKKLVDGIRLHVENSNMEFIKPYIQLNQSIQLKKMIPNGTAVQQTIIFNDGNVVDVVIAHQSNNSKFIKDLKNKQAGVASIDGYDKVLKDMNDSKIMPEHAEIYRITLAKKDKQELDDKALKAATDLIVDSDDNVSNILPRRGKIDVLSSSIIYEISYDARRNDSAIAERFIRELEYHHVNRFMRSSLAENRENIYKAASRYYRSAANSILNKLDNFEIAGKKYSMDDPEMYEVLSKHDEYFNEVSKIILDGITFGNKISEIFKLDITAEDKETKDAIENIIKNINSVRQNKKLSDAMNNIINIYFKKYSTNPEIINDVLQLRETFGDLDVIDRWIANPADIDNNEVQTIIKQVYSMFAKAEMFDTKRNVKEFKDAVAEIEAMPGVLDINNVIDFNNFKIRQGYNEDYLKARQEVLDRLNEAKAKKDNSDEDYTNYIKAKYDRDKFMYENTEQHIIDDYYKRDLAIRDKVMRKAGNTYIKYIQLTEQLYNNNNNSKLSIEEKRRLIGMIMQLRSKTDITGNPKSIEAASKSRALDKFIKAKTELNEQYFSSQEYDGFQEDYNRYKRYIDAYNKSHKFDSLEQKLEDAAYKEAYDWIKSNGKVMFGKKQSEELSNAFKLLTGHKSVISKKTAARLKAIPEVVDENGNIDPTKLTDAQIDQLRKEQEEEYNIMLDDELNDFVLIKDVPDDIYISNLSKKKTPKAKKASEELKYSNIKLKNETIAKINTIISRCVDRETGKIDVPALFNNDVVSDEERIALAEYYRTLRNLRVAERRRYKKRKTEVYDDETNDVGFLEAMNYYKLNLVGTKQAKQFLDIFTELDATGNIVANSDIYGFRNPKIDYIDWEKTDALNYIKNNADFVPTEYYEIERRKAEEAGVNAYNKWFKRNHVYNPYSHKFEPLRIWTKLEAKPGSELTESISYVPTFDNMERYVKPEYINNEENRKRLNLKGKGYKKFSSNYKTSTGKYNSNITLNPKEEAMRDLLINTLNKYATTYKGKHFINQGYLPRENKNEIDTRWVAEQAGALLGLSWRSGADSDSFYEQIDYSHDRDAEMKMLSLFKGKGYKKYKPIPTDDGFENKEKYNEVVAKIKEENKKIKEENEKIESANINKDWKEVMENFVHNATIFNSRQAAKPYLYLLLEDLSVNNAYMIKGLWNKHLVKDNKITTKDDDQFRTIPQTHTREIVHTLTRRLLFDQYHNNTTMRSVANFLQNMTSAKYMIFNLYGGISNIATGKANIAMEEYANEYFGFNEFLSAEKQYLLAMPDTIASMYSDKSHNITTALIKEFNVVDFDQILQFGAGSMGLDEKLRRIRSWMYSFQSIGEHYMQNSVLLAMLKSNRLYTDNKGVRRIGDFKDFTWDIEQQAMEMTISDDKNLSSNYKIYRESIKYDIEEKFNIDSGRKDFNRNFLYSLRDSNDKDIKNVYKKIAEKYYKNRKKLMETAKQQFNSNPTVESLYKFENGNAVLSSKAIADFNAKGKNSIGDLEHLIGGFKRKVESVNQKIHGVYDRNGAAQLETKALGSLVMQYHKHLYTGIMKRWRRKGYYSEFRGSRERGSYQTVIDFIGSEFINFDKRIKDKQSNGTNIALASIQVAMESVLNSLINIKFNWNNLSNWERANIRRNLGDASGVLVACLITMALYSLNDDDDIKDDKFKASLLYLADRLYSETSMYTPQGLITEYKTAWSSPIASANGPSDLIKAIQLIPQALFDPDYNPNYQTGQYAGKNKIEVLLRRNIPGVRPYDRIQFITKNNKYYKIGERQIGINIAKNFGELLNE